VTDPRDAIQDLSDAFTARDLAAALACFAPGEDIGYAGSEKDETASGRPAVSALLAALFLRPEAYGWTTHTATVHRYGSKAYIYAEAEGVVHPDTGKTETFPYRLAGAVELTKGRWRWRHCQGSEPT
jgi:SnoaL-like protein